VTFEVGPVLRTLRRQPGVLALVVLDLAVAFTIISSLLLSASWYGEVGGRTSGLDEQNLIYVSTYTPAGAGADPEAAVAMQQEADKARARAVPGVVAASSVSTAVVDDRWAYPDQFRVVRSGAPPAEAVGWLVFGDADLARTYGLRLVTGALPVALPASGVAYLSRCLSDRLFDGPQQAIGQPLPGERFGGLPIAGVVEDVTVRTSFMPWAHCGAFVLGVHPHDLEDRILVRAAPGRRDQVVAGLRAALGPSSGQRFVEVRTFDATSTRPYRIGHGLLQMLTGFGVLVAAMALLGSLAASSFLVAQRTRQIGTRRALGATRGDIVRYFLVESTLTTALGVLVGLGGTSAVFAMMRAVFPAISLQPSLVALALVLLWAGSVVATLVPALRAARIPPSVAGRSL
jgi:putative ABC transport system permease protein